MADYTQSSPWHNTPENTSGEYMDLLRVRTVPSSPDDALYEIEPQYNFRPDLLAYDLYGTPKLWWVFAQRNLDILKDPVFDFVAGTKIYLPQGRHLRENLGIM